MTIDRGVADQAVKKSWCFAFAEGVHRIIWVEICRQSVVGSVEAVIVSVLAPSAGGLTYKVMLAVFGYVRSPGA